MRKSSTVLIIVPAALSVLAAACAPNKTVLESGATNTAPINAATPRSALEADMADMRTAGFSFIYILRRKDGNKLDAADRSFIKAQTEDMNRRVASDEDRAVIIGSNYQLPEANLDILKGRFTVETISQPTPANTNGNANTSK